MRVAVTGAKGRLGLELVSRHGCIPIESDITDFDALSAELGRIAPDAVINTAAYTEVDEAEEKVKDAIVVNTRGAGNVRIAYDGFLIHLSTSYVFNGESKDSYMEDAEPEPKGGYAWSKWGGEVAILSVMRNKPTLIVRTVNLYGGPSGKPDFVRTVLEKLAFGQDFDLPTFLRSTPTYVPHLAEGIMKAIELKELGILNISGVTPISRYDWALEIAKEWGFLTRTIHKNTDDLIVMRPRNACLDTSKAKRLGIPVYSLRDGLKAFHADQTD